MRRVGILFAIVAVCLLAAGPAQARTQKATAVYMNGYVYTVDESKPLAQAVAVRGDKIVYVGTDAGVKKLIGAKTAVVDLKGRLLMPGLIDSHQHPFAGGQREGSFDIGNIQRTIPAFQALMQGWLDQTKSQEPDGWFEAFGYRGALPRGTNLTKADLDALTTQRPVVVHNWDMHSIWVNSRALAICGIDKTTPDVPDGIIERDAQGEPTGYLADAAMDLVTSKIPATDAEAPEVTAERAVKALNEVGITMVMDAYADDSSLALWTGVLEQGKLTMRLANAVFVSDEAAWKADPQGQIDLCNGLRTKYQVPDRLLVDTMKFIDDGVPDFPAQNAWMLEPYLVQNADGAWVPGTWRGESWWTPEELVKAYVAANKAGWQTHMHALGDASVRLTLDAVEAAQKAGASKDLRDTIVHLEPVMRSDVVRFGELNVVANIQPQWGEWDSSTWDAAYNFLGPDRMENIYPLRSFELAGAPIA